MSIITQLFTESDNVTHDLYRYLAVLAIAVGLGLSVYSVVWKSQPFDMLAFGTGIGSLFAGVGVALKLRRETIDVPIERLPNANP